MPVITKTVFLSYRRKDGAWALSIYGWLTQRGYDVFIDYENIASGAFASAIDENILARAHFLVVLSPTALDRCDRPGDWLRHEVETAMTRGRNIVPIMVDGFSFQADSTVSKLTGLLAHLSAYNGLELTLATFHDKMQRLADRFLNVALKHVVHPPGVKAVQIDAALHPASPEAARVAKDQQAKADAAPIQTPPESAADPEPHGDLSNSEVHSSKRFHVRNLTLWAKNFWALIAIASIIFIVVQTQIVSKPTSAVHPVDQIARDAAYKQKLFEELGRSVVRVRVRTGGQAGETTIAYGTAFYVSDATKLATAAHLIGNETPESIEVSSSDGIWSAAIVLQVDKALDIAVLALKNPLASKAIQLDSNPARVGEELYIIGWPLDSDLYFAIGNVTRLDARRSRLSVVVGPGLSGAPVINSSGLVIGMIVAGTADSATAFYLPSSEFGHLIGGAK